MIAVFFWVFLAVILYTYLGYPLILFLLARLKPAKTLKGSYQPTVTLLIAAYNEEDCIAQKLENSLHLAYPADKLQILVAADGSDDQTEAIVKSFAPKGVALSYQPLREGKMAAINRAMDAGARGNHCFLRRQQPLSGRHDPGAGRSNYRSTDRWCQWCQNDCPQQRHLWPLGR